MSAFRRTYNWTDQFRIAPDFIESPRPERQVVPMDEHWIVPDPPCVECAIKAGCLYECRKFKEFCDITRDNKKRVLEYRPVRNAWQREYRKTHGVELRAKQKLARERRKAERLAEMNQEKEVSNG